MRKQALWLVPIFLMILITPFTPTLDLEIERYFYQRGAGEVEHFISNPFVNFLFDYARYPALMVWAPAVIALILSYSSPFWKKWRAPALTLVLTLAIGAGLIVNLLLKDHWGRPRPKQVEEFSGQQPFRPYYSPNFFNQPEPSKSFPCGHCSMGFYFLAFFFVGQRLHKKWLSSFGLMFGLGFGTLLGIARMAQGGHFLSDVLMGGLIMWLTALLLDKLIYSSEIVET
jgi:lipid A 4'-phosphatase